MTVKSSGEGSSEAEPVAGATVLAPASDLPSASCSWAGATTSEVWLDDGVGAAGGLVAAVSGGVETVMVQVCLVKISAPSWPRAGVGPYGRTSYGHPPVSQT